MGKQHVLGTTSCPWSHRRGSSRRSKRPISSVSPHANLLPQQEPATTSTQAMTTWTSPLRSRYPTVARQHTNRDAPVVRDQHRTNKSFLGVYKSHRKSLMARLQTRHRRYEQGAHEHFHRMAENHAYNELSEDERQLFIDAANTLYGRALRVSQLASLDEDSFFHAYSRLPTTGNYCRRHAVEDRSPTSTDDINVSSAVELLETIVARFDHLPQRPLHDSHPALLALHLNVPMTHRRGTHDLPIRRVRESTTHSCATTSRDTNTAHSPSLTRREAMQTIR